MDPEQVGALILMLALSIVTVAYAFQHFRNRSLSRQVERLEAERESLLHHIEVQREILFSRLSPDAEEKVAEAAGHMAEVFKLGLGIQQRIKANRMAKEKKEDG